MRDYISEIIEIRNRQGRSVTLESIQELGILNDIWHQRTEQRDILRNYIPIRIVTIIEVFVRNWISIIIDHGDPFLANAVGLSKNINIKFDLPLISAMHGKKITLGELIAHNLSYNNIDHINSNLSIIVGQNLKLILSNAKVRSLDNDLNAKYEKIIADVDSDYALIEGLFRVRHVIVHEVPEIFPASDAAVGDFLNSSNRFATAIDFSFYSMLYGEMPLSQTEMNEAASEAYEKAVQQMDDLLSGAPHEIDNYELAQSQEKWIEYKNAHCRLVSGINEPFHGSMAPMLFASEAEELTKERTSRLKAYFSSFSDH